MRYRVKDDENTWSPYEEKTITVNPATISFTLNRNKNWMYQNLPSSTNYRITITAAGISDPMGNSSYTYNWQVILPQDVSTAPAVVSGGGASDNFITLAAPACSSGTGLSNSGMPHTVKLTITGNQHSNTGITESEFYVCLLGDVNNDTVVNLADRTIINAYWKNGVAGSFTLEDCDLNCDGVVNLADRTIANAVWKGALGQDTVGMKCPIR